jgi:hypothetical protein
MAHDTQGSLSALTAAQETEENTPENLADIDKALLVSRDRLDGELNNNRNNTLKNRGFTTAKNIATGAVVAGLTIATAASFGAAAPITLPLAGAIIAESVLESALGIPGDVANLSKENSESISKMITEVRDLPPEEIRSMAQEYDNNKEAAALPSLSLGDANNTACCLANVSRG